MDDKKPDKSVNTEKDKIIVSIYLSPKTLEKVDDFFVLCKEEIADGKKKKTD